mgnify:FL=1
MIEVKNLVKRYGDHVAVNNLSFTVEEGQIYGFLGPNGAGKSTTMNIITGYLASTEGEVLINGHNILEEPEEAKKMHRLSAGAAAGLYGYDRSGISEICGRIKENSEGSEKETDS